MHLIAVDVGNSRIKIGLFATQRNNCAVPLAVHVQVVDLDSDICWGRFSDLVSGDRDVTGVIAATNPRHVDRISESWPAEWIQPLRRVDRACLPIETAVTAPTKVGIDRLLNAVAANWPPPTDRATIIVDTGTATTVDLISQAGIFQGGAILPGLALSARALHEYTALLPLVSLEELRLPCQPLGRETASAIHSGLLWGQVGAIRELTSQYLTELTGPVDTILTGGAADLLHGQFPEFTLRRHLALEGLAIYGATLQEH